MNSRWSDEETSLIFEMRRRLDCQLSDRPQFPEVVGDRRILRFLRGFNHNIENSFRAMSEFLKWRLENGIDSIRNDIVYGGKNNPLLFPKGDVILKLAPQIVLSTKSKDKHGNPISIETFNFSPIEVLKQISIDDYIMFLIYTLEYKMLLLEQLSELKEREYLQQNKDIPSTEPYGVILRHTIIRDLSGIGLEHIGDDGRNIISAALKVSESNYAELLHKSYFINAPWVFTVLWYFIKNILNPTTAAKLSLLGTDYYSSLIEDISIDMLPTQFGGSNNIENENFIFDTAIGGSLYYDGAPKENTSETSKASLLDINNLPEVSLSEVQS
eukprot:gene7024-14292_t